MQFSPLKTRVSRRPSTAVLIKPQPQQQLLHEPSPLPNSPSPKSTKQTIKIMPKRTKTRETRENRDLQHFWTPGDTELELVNPSTKPSKTETSLTITEELLSLPSI